MWTLSGVIWTLRGSSEVNMQIQGCHLRWLRTFSGSSVPVWEGPGPSLGLVISTCEVNVDTKEGHLRWMWTFRGVIWWQCGRSGGHLMTMWTLSGVIWTLRWICKFRGVIWGEWGHSGHLSWMWTFRGVLHLPSSSMWFWTILHLNFILNISSLANNLYQLPNLVAL